MYFKQFFDEKLAQYAYMIGCQANGTAIVIDPMRDIEQYQIVAEKENLKIVAAADTHIHADYISGLRQFAEAGVKVYASDEGDKDWKYEWLKNSDYDHQLLKDGDEIKLGNITIKAWYTPGHTPEHLSYFITDGAAADMPMGIATGDFVFVGDVGRPDLLESAAGQTNVMEPSARTLFKSVEAFKNIPEYMQIWPGHGAGSACGKALGAIPESTVGYELRFNNSIKSATSEDNFVDFILEGQPEPPMYFARMKRDNKLGPKVLKEIPSPKRMSVEEVIKESKKTNVVVLDSRTKESFFEGHIAGSILSTLNKQFNTIAGSYITDEDKIFLVVDENRVKEAVIDLIHIGLDNITGFITAEDLKAYQESGNALESIHTDTFAGISKYKQDDRYQIVDVRKATEYAPSHIEGALNIAHTRLHSRLEEVPLSKKIVVHCQLGGRAAVASAFLKNKGFDVVMIDDAFENYEGK